MDLFLPWLDSHPGLAALLGGVIAHPLSLRVVLRLRYDVRKLRDYVGWASRVQGMKTQPPEIR